MEASRLRQKAEELVRDNEPLPSPSPSLASFDHLAELTGTRGARGVPSSPCSSLSSPLTLHLLRHQKPASPSFILRPRGIFPVMLWL